MQVSGYGSKLKKSDGMYTLMNVRNLGVGEHGKTDGNVWIGTLKISHNSKQAKSYNALSANAEATFMAC